MTWPYSALQKASASIGMSASTNVLTMHAANPVASRDKDKLASFTLSGSGTTSVNQSRLVISRCFECLEDLSHFLPPLIGVGAVHPVGRHL